MEDLNAATLEDVHEWFETYYGPNNATLVLAGDVDVATAREKVEHYFGDIPPGPPLTRKRTRGSRQRAGEPHRHAGPRAEARIYKVWNVPGWSSDESDVPRARRLRARGGKTSRLYSGSSTRTRSRPTSARSADARDRGRLRRLCDRRGRRGPRAQSSARSTRSSRASSPRARRATSSSASRPRSAPVHPRRRARRRLRRQVATSSPRTPSSAAGPTSTSIRSSVLNGATPQTGAQRRRASGSTGEPLVLEVHPFPTELAAERRRRGSHEAADAAERSPRRRSRRSQQATLRTACS